MCVLGVLGESERDLRENARVVCVVFVVVDENEGGERGISGWSPWLNVHHTPQIS